MAKIQTRKTVSLSAEGFQILRRLSRERETPMSAILEGLIRESAKMAHIPQDARATRGLSGVCFFT